MEYRRLAKNWTSEVHVSDLERERVPALQRGRGRTLRCAAVASHSRQLRTGGVCEEEEEEAEAEHACRLCRATEERAVAALVLTGTR